MGSERIQGVYTIQRVDNPNQLYIGSSVNILGRWKSHKRQLVDGSHSNKYLQNLVTKHGISILKFSILEQTDFNVDKDLRDLEQYYIDAFIGLYDRVMLLNMVLDTMMYDMNKDSEFSKYRLSRLQEELGKPVRCIEKAIVFKSINEAARVMYSDYGVDIQASSISNCCTKTKIKSAGGYHWCFEGMQDSVVVGKVHFRRKVRLLEIDKIFDSVADAGRYIKEFVNPKAYGYPISACCLGNLKSAYGFKWEFA